MKRPNQFYCRVYKDGTKSIDVVVWNNEFSLLRSFVLFFSSINELKWIENEINIELLKVGKTSTGLNTLKIGVNENEIELSHNYDLKNIQIVPTVVALDFISECITFHEEYNSGNIPGIIPDSKKDEWVIVPKEYVKDEYLKKLISEEE